MKNKHFMIKKLISREYKDIYIIIILIILIRCFIVEPFRIPSGSMQPTLLIGDFIFVNKFIYGIKIPTTKKIIAKKPERGDVIVFKKQDKKNYIKRIIGTENDEILYKNKNIYINKIKIKKKFKGKETLIDTKNTIINISNFKEYLNPKKEYSIKIYDYYKNENYNFSNIIVPRDSYFLLGDNRDNSEDSRFWGFIKNNQITGKAFIIWISIDIKNIDIRWNRILKEIK